MSSLSGYSSNVLLFFLSLSFPLSFFLSQSVSVCLSNTKMDFVTYMTWKPGEILLIFTLEIVHSLSLIIYFNGCISYWFYIFCTHISIHLDRTLILALGFMSASVGLCSMCQSVHMCSCEFGSSLLVHCKSYVSSDLVAVSCRLIIYFDYFPFWGLSVVHGRFESKPFLLMYLLFM